MKDFDLARKSVDDILKRYHGYMRAHGLGNTTDGSRVRSTLQNCGFLCEPRLRIDGIESTWTGRGRSPERRGSYQQYVANAR